MAVRCLSCVVCYVWLFVVCCLLFVCCLLLVVGYALFVIWCSLFLLFVYYCSFVVGCLSLGEYRLLRVGACLLLVIGCFFCVVC